MTIHGGKRTGAGRPKGSKAIQSELRAAAQAHTDEAVKALVEIMNDKGHSQRVKAAQIILERGHGAAKVEPASVEIINQFVERKLSAIAACLMLEAEGLKVPEILKHYFKNEMDIATHIHPRHKVGSKLFEPPTPLPRD